MLPVLYNSEEFKHVPIRERRRAAWEARQQAMKHWQFWFSLGFLVVATVSGSLVAQHWLGDKPDGTIGAVCGFLMGLAWYARTLFRIGMPYYRQILSQHENHNYEQQ
jgi:hypothetical protein